MQLDLIDRILLIAIPIFLTILATCKYPEIKSSRPCIMPDYRPGFDCFRFEKLP